jgi:hypothetical protein
MMKSNFSCLLLVFMVFTTTLKAQEKKAVQEFIEVDAKVRGYHSEGKVSYKDYQPFKTRTVQLLAGYKLSENAVLLSKYGGNKAMKTKATGFFHVKKVDGRWWAIDPEGCFYFNIALNSINVGKSERNQKALTEMFGNKETWMKQTIQLLRENGFNCAGSWSDVEAIREANKTLDKPLAYCINWNFMSSYGHERGGIFQQAGHMGYPKNAIFVFDPEFETFCDRHAQNLA